MARCFSRETPVHWHLRGLLWFALLEGNKVGVQTTKLIKMEGSIRFWIDFCESIESKVSCIYNLSCWVSIISEKMVQNSHGIWLAQPMDPEKKSLNFIFPTKYVIPKSLKFSHWLSELVGQKSMITQYSRLQTPCGFLVGLAKRFHTFETHQNIPKRDLDELQNTLRWIYVSKCHFEHSYGSGSGADLSQGKHTNN